MRESNNNTREVKIYHLRTTYKKYTNFIINFQKHIERLYHEMIITINARNMALQQLNDLIKNMIAIFNENVKRIYRESDTEIIESDEKCFMPDDIYNDSDEYEKIYEPNQTEEILKTRSVSDLEELIDKNIAYKNYQKTMNMMGLLNNTQKEDPFENIKEKLLEIGSSKGFYSISDFLEIYIGEHYMYLIDESNKDTFNAYNRVFVPVGYTIDDMIPQYSKRIIVKPCDIDCDVLIENSLSICLQIDGESITIEGYIAHNPLNIYTRTSQINSKFIFNKKNKIEAILREYNHGIDKNFEIKYMRFINENSYFIYSPKEFVNRMINHYHKYIIMGNRDITVLMNEFIKSDLTNMYTMINLLLMGSRHHTKYASALFKLLTEKKINGQLLCDIIHSNLSYFGQAKLKKGISLIREELLRLKNLNIEEVSIEKKIASMDNMPESVKKYIMEKINEMKNGENVYKLQMAIDGLIKFPWKSNSSNYEYAMIRKSMSSSRDYIQNVAKKLDESVYGHENGKKILIELVGKWIQNPDSTGQVIGLVGPPGVGKTLLAKSISNALGIPFSIVGLGGISDSSDLIGHNFTYTGAQYGMIIRQMIQAGNWRCVMFFDEVDKVGKRNDTNEIYNTLIHITDPNMNKNFQDRFYSSSIDFDLSGVLIVFSYNNSDKLDPILLDRIKEIHISSYSIQEKIKIAQGYMMKELCTNIGFNRDKIHFDDSTIRYIIEKYTLEAGVRELRRKMEQILLKTNIDRIYMRGPFRNMMINYYEISNNVKKNKIFELEMEESDQKDSNIGISSYVTYKKSNIENMIDQNTLNKIFNMEIDEKLIIDKDLIHRYLDKPTLTFDEIHKRDIIGVINGLYATTVGMGGIVPIQISKSYISDCNDGINMRLRLTGNQQAIMKESVICAFTTAVNLINKTISDSLTNNYPNGFHIHAPDASTPKDGPSAGCAYATAFVSILLGKKINREIAMTGEIELTGKINKIGGLDAKLNGAKRAGVKKVFICEENRDDYLEIKKKSPELFDDSFKVEIITHIIDIVTNPEIILGVTLDDFDKDMLCEYGMKI